MKLPSHLVACLGTSVSVWLLVAATLQPVSSPRPVPALPKAALPCLVIQEIETDAPQSYAMWIAEANKVIKDKFGLDNYRHVFVGESAGPDTGVVFAVTRADSFATLTGNEMKFAKEAALVEARLNMRDIRKLGENVSYRAVRFDGAHPDAAVSNTKAVLSDEAAYLKELDGLRGLFDAHDLKDVKINCYRVAAGRSNFTHLVSLNCPSRERRAAMMDAISTEPWAIEWVANAAKFRTVVSNGTYREITPPQALVR